MHCTAAYVRNSHGSEQHPTGRRQSFICQHPVLSCDGCDFISRNKNHIGIGITDTEPELPPCGKLSVAGDCAYTVTGEVIIRAVPKSSAGKLFFIGYLIETANAGKATGVLKAETIVF